MPSDYWQWEHPSWMIDMLGDVDENGWSYAVRFRSQNYRGVAKWFVCVRRRTWVRGRVYIPQTTLTKPKQTTTDWNALKLEHSSEFLPGAKRANPPPPGAEHRGLGTFRGTGVIGLKAAIALLPFEEDVKTDLYRGGEVLLDVRNPFLAWSEVEHEGRKTLTSRAQRRAGSSEAEDVMAVWRDAVIEINYRM